MASVNLKNRDDGTEREADLFDDVSMNDFTESQDIWRPVLLAACATLKLQGKPIPLYKHWDWRTKSGFLGRLDVTFFGIRCDAHLQGLMKADLGTLYRCRLGDQKGKEFVYVDYVETAPWNIPDYMEPLGFKALYSRVGTRLMQAAVQLSLDNELKGRVGLHSLPDAEGFYRELGMTPGERDATKQNLLWFEFTPEAAQDFMEKYA